MYAGDRPGPTSKRYHATRPKVCLGARSGGVLARGELPAVGEYREGIPQLVTSCWYSLHLDELISQPSYDSRTTTPQYRIRASP